MSERSALVVGYHVPEADRDSGARRLVHFMNLLREQGWRIRFLAADGIGSERAAADLRSRGVAVYDGYQTRLDEILAEGPVDLALIAFWLNADRYLPTLRHLSPETRIVVDSVDLHFVRETRRVLRPRSGAGGMGLGTHQAIRAAGELNTYAAADLVLTVSAHEAQLVNGLLSDPRAAWAVPDFEDLPASRAPFEQRRGLVFVGSFQHPPNAEAVAFLCREVLPKVDPSVLDDHPVYVVGNALGDDVRALSRDLPQVRMVGWVPFVEPYLEHARASLVPLLHGAGTKRKLIQSLVAGTPTVSTAIGVEGLDLRHEEHVLIADDAAAFATCIERLVRDEELWNRLAAAGREAVLRTNGREPVRSAFVAAIEEVFARTPKRVVPVGVPRAGREVTPEPQLDARHLGAVLRAVCRRGSRVLVMTGGDAALLSLPGYAAAPFPQDTDGRWSPIELTSSRAVVDHLQRLSASGFSYLVVPCSSFPLLDVHPELRLHLDEQALVCYRDERCAVIRLDPHADEPMPAAETAHGVPPITVLGPLAPGPTYDVRVVALYLPQFHPIPENDAWWGPGFTEWRNVARAVPQFDGHHQPHVPADLGFYDLRLAETRWQQAQLARSHGIHGFCYYHYWFHGQRLLGRPFDDVLRSGEPDLPFALCWANDPWSRRWDGREDELLMRQAYSPEDDLEHIRWLLPALADPRAIRVGGRPMFLVYRAKHLPDPQRTTDLWREEVERAGLPGLHLVAVETAWDLGWDATSVGFDARLLFQPQFGWLITQARTHQARIEVPGKPDLQVYDYDRIRKAVAGIEPVSYRRYESVFPGWDNTARVGERAVVMHGNTPEGYEAWLSEAVERARSRPGHELVFVNAWNEWAEGCHLEPDRRHGRAFLEATQRALERAGRVAVGRR